MVLKTWGMVICFVLLLCCGIPATGAAGTADYLLAPQDVLDISVYGYQELQLHQIEIRPDGKLSFPLVGEVRAAGLTISQFTRELSRSLADYVRNPQVTVNVTTFHTIRVYVLGEVAHPGMYKVEERYKVLDALALAGGDTPYTSKKSVYFVRDSAKQCVTVDLDKMLKKGDLSQNYSLGDGDVLYLGKNGLSFVRDILPIITGIYSVKEILK